jgi:hypothetical protein
VIFAFLIGIAVTLLIPILGVLAFGGKLLDESDSGKLKYFNEDFISEAPFIYYFTS